MIQIIKQTRKEKIKTYMRLPKKQIAEMLANCNEILEATRPTVIYPQTSSTGVIYANTLNATASFATDEAKSKTTGKTGLEKKRRNTRKSNSKKR